LAALGLLTLFASCGACGGGSGTGAPPVATVPAFQTDRAWADLLKQCSFGPRNPGSTGHQAQLAWMRTTLQPLADRVVEQPFTTATSWGGPYDFVNLIAVFNGKATGPAAMVLAHWDTRAVSDEDPDPARRSEPTMGANDGAAGVGILLELARLFKATPPAHPVYLVFLDAEDTGKQGSALLDMGWCLGSNYLAQHWPAELPRPSQGALLDLVGGTQPDPRCPPRTDIGGDAIFDVQIEQNSFNMCPAVVNQIWTVAAQRGHLDFKRTLGEPLIDDHLAFNNVGLPTADVEDFPPPIWHTADDLPQFCTSAALAEVGDTMEAWLYGL
jgi:hypothetical protein